MRMKVISLAATMIQRVNHSLYVQVITFILVANTFAVVIKLMLYSKYTL